MMTGETTLQWSIPLDRTIDAKRTLEAAVAASRTLLTGRQARVLDLLALGFTYQEIGERLELSSERIRQIANTAKYVLAGKIVCVYERNEAIIETLLIRQCAEQARVERDEDLREQQLAHEHFARVMREKERAAAAIVAKAHTLFPQLDFLRREQLRLNGGQRTLQ